MYYATMVTERIAVLLLCYKDTEGANCPVGAGWCYILCPIHAALSRDIPAAYQEEVSQNT